MDPPRAGAGVALDLLDKLRASLLVPALRDGVGWKAPARMARDGAVVGEQEREANGGGWGATGWIG